MSSRCFRSESSSSGRRLYIQLRYSTYYMHQYKQSCRWKSWFRRTHFTTSKTAYTDAYKTCCTVPVNITVFLKMDPRLRNM